MERSVAASASQTADVAFAAPQLRVWFGGSQTGVVVVRAMQDGNHN